MTERTKPADTTEENDESGKDGAQQIVDFGSALTKTPHGSVYCMTIIGQIEGHNTAARINPYSRNQLFSLINTLLTLFGAGMKIVTGAAHRNRLSRSRPPAAGSPGAPAAPAARTRPCRSRM